VNEVAAILSGSVVSGLGDNDCFLADSLAQLNDAFLRTLLAWAAHDGVDVASRMFGMPAETLEVLTKRLVGSEACRSFGREPFSFLTLDCGRVALADSPAGRIGPVTRKQPGREHFRLLQVVQCMYVDIVRAVQREQPLVIDALLGVPAEGRHAIDHMVRDPSAWMQTTRPWVVARSLFVRRVCSPQWASLERYSALVDMLLTGVDT